MMHDIGTPRSDHGKERDSGVGFLKNFDIYTKVDENYRVQTSWGAILSIAGWVVIAVLVISELRHYATVQVKEHMIVDTTLGQPLFININVTFHALTCADVHLDVMDVAGDNQLNIEHDMYKQRISRSGKPIGKPALQIISDDDNTPALPADYCGPCYGAETEESKCCNTCDDLKRAYQAKGWNINLLLRNASQCLRDHSNPFANVRQGEGCRISGSMKVNKVAGNFHMTLGESIVRDGAHIHQFIPSEASGFNVSHTIHSLSFGERYDSMAPNPLDSVRRIVEKDPGTGLYQYFIKVIPTIVTTEYGRTLFTNQYSYTEKFRPFQMPTDLQQVTVIPGIFFIYDVAPFLVEVQRSRLPISHVLVRLFAIVGGVFSIMGVLDALLYRLQKLTGKTSKTLH